MLNFKRFYLLAAVVLALVVPLLSDYLYFFSSNSMVSYIDLELVNSQINSFQYEALKIGNLKVSDSETIHLWYWIYLIVTAFFVIRYGANLYHILKLTHRKGPRINGMQSILIREESNPFSFFNYVFINENEFAKLANNHAILSHEKAHALQKHSIDLVFIGFVKAVFWFNPILLAFKKAMQDNHEYLADNYACKQLIDRNAYLLEIMNYIKTKKNLNPLSSHFAHQIIKKRIQMIQEKKPKTMKKALTISFSIATTFALLTVFSFTIKETDLPSTIGTAIHKTTDRHTPSILPMPKSAITKISSAFGMRHNPFLKSKQMHKGIDIVAPKGTAIVATADGKVYYAGFSQGYGNHIKIKHGDTYETMYAHLDKLEVKSGELVKKGERIGLIGNTGKSVKTHLHYEVEKEDKKVDPALYFEYEIIGN